MTTPNIQIKDIEGIVQVKEVAKAQLVDLVIPKIPIFHLDST